MDGPLKDCSHIGVVYKIPYRRAPRLAECVARAKVSCIQILEKLRSCVQDTVSLRPPIYILSYKKFWPPFADLGF